MLLIFDLDGTLIDSRLDLAHAVNATLIHMGHATLPNELIWSYVGNGARTLVRRATGLPEGDAAFEQAHAYFLGFYKAHSLERTVTYPGVMEGLRTLQADAHQLAVLTNKPVQISNDILQGLGMAGFFFEVLGGNSFPFQKPNPIGINQLREATGVSASDTWMVGDSAVDIETARNAGVHSCGLTYGFKPESLELTPPDLLAPDFGTFVAHIRTLRL